MSALPTVPGYGIGDPRNGMPEPGYAYRGTGYDTLTPPAEMARWTNRTLSLAGLTASPRTHADVARVLAVERQLALTATTAIPVPAAPGRCTGCGYMFTAPGHKAACGGAR